MRVHANARRRRRRYRAQRGRWGWRRARNGVRRGISRFLPRHRDENCCDQYERTEGRECAAEGVLVLVHGETSVLCAGCGNAIGPAEDLMRGVYTSFSRLADSFPSAERVWRPVPEPRQRVGKTRAPCPHVPQKHRAKIKRNPDKRDRPFLIQPHPVICMSTLPARAGKGAQRSDALPAFPDNITRPNQWNQEAPLPFVRPVLGNGTRYFSSRRRTPSSTRAVGKVTEVSSLTPLVLRNVRQLKRVPASFSL